MTRSARVRRWQAGLVLLLWCGVLAVPAVATPAEPVGHTLIEQQNLLIEWREPALVGDTGSFVRAWSEFEFDRATVDNPSWPADAVARKRDDPPPVDFANQVVVLLTGPDGQWGEELVGVERDGAVISLDFRSSEPAVIGGIPYVTVRAVALDRVDLPSGPVVVQARLDGEVIDRTETVIGPAPVWRPTGQPVAWQVASRVNVYDDRTGANRHNRAPLAPVLVSSSGELSGLWRAYDPGRTRDGQRLEHRWGPMPDIDFDTHVGVVFTTTRDGRAGWEIDGVRAANHDLHVKLRYAEEGRLDEQIVELWVLALARDDLPVGGVKLAVIGPDGYEWAADRGRIAAPATPSPWLWWLVGGALAGGLLLAVVARPAAGRTGAVPT